MKKTLSIPGSVVLLAIGLIFVSAPACAQTWIGHQVSTNDSATLLCRASSADGATLVVGSGSGDESESSPGQVFVSTDSDVSWRPTSAPSNWWTSVACSADGAKMAGVNLRTNGSICTSTDSGNTWIPRYDFFAGGSDVASSADGTKLVALGTTGSFPTHARIALSTDSGANWALANFAYSNIVWGAVASSADGTRLVVAASGFSQSPKIYLSSDSGIYWTPANLPFISWTSVASSADGSKLAATSPLPIPGKRCPRLPSWLAEEAS